MIPSFSRGFLGGAGNAGELGEDLDKAAAAGVEGLVDGSDHDGGDGGCRGVLDWGLFPAAAEMIFVSPDGLGRGFLENLGHHFCGVCRNLQRNEDLGFSREAYEGGFAESWLILKLGLVATVDCKGVLNLECRDER